MWITFGKYINMNRDEKVSITKFQLNEEEVLGL